MENHEILAAYNEALKVARQSNRDNPQMAHVEALQVVFAAGAESTGKGPDLPQEEPAKAHQRRLLSADHWLQRHGRRQRFSENPTFAGILESFAAGAAYERASMDGNFDYEAEAEALIQTSDHEMVRIVDEREKLRTFRENVRDAIAPNAETDDQILAALTALRVGPAISGDDVLVKIKEAICPHAKSMDEVLAALNVLLGPMDGVNFGH